MRARGGRVPHGNFGPPALRHRIVEIFQVLLLAAVAGYAGVVLLAWLGQEKLLFYPRPIESKPVAPAGWTLEEVAFTSRDGTRLAGVLLLPPVSKPPLVIYFGGNAEEVTSFAPMANEYYANRALLLVNYRAYGASAGKPGEAALVSDGLELFDWARARSDIDGSRIAVHGRSLGSGVAVQVAAARPVKCVMLTSPFLSAREVARELYPWLPVSLLLRHPFDSAARAPGIKVPALFFMGAADTLVPMWQSEQLASLWGGPAERKVFEGFGHNDIHVNPQYGIAIREFLDRCL
ncbi:MAG TPA: alpha/beta hydrolase [Usitatibacter sp.]|nr:alpha/beta hydrolase [Usitatibacter sp.]